MQLTFLLPGLLLPGPVLRDTAFDLDLPALARMLGRGRQSWSGPASAYGWLAAACGLGSRLPAAPLRLLAAGGDPGDGEWLCLDPVHLHLKEMAVMVGDPRRLTLTVAEDAALREAVTPLLAEVGELAAASEPGRWHLRLAGPAPESPDLPEAAGRPADPALPGGPEGPRWRRLLAEIQMRFHAHPVNRAREAAGLPTANSLWPWGAGRLPAATPAPFDALQTGDPALQGLAVHLRVPTDAASLGSGPDHRHMLAHLDQLAGPAQTLDALAWRAGLQTVEHDWLAPALAALRDGHCRSLRLVATGEEDSLDLELTRWDLWRFWRPPLPLARLRS